MSQIDSGDLWKVHRDGQDKYAYFLLADAAAAIGYAFQKADAEKLTWWLASFFGAICAWGMSFYFGCRHLIWVQSSVYANFSLLQLNEGIHPQQPPHPELTAAARSGVRLAIENNSKKSQRTSFWQFLLLVVGAILYIAWRITAMYRLTFIH
jgi:hypothetical protein